MVASSFAFAACAPHVTASASKSGSDDPGARPATSPPVAATTTPPEPETAAPALQATVADGAGQTPHAKLVAWFKAGALPGDEVVDGGETGSVDIVHTVARGEIPAVVSHAYLAYSDTFFEDDFTEEIAKSARKEGGFRPGNKIHLPHLVTEAPKSAADERLPPVADGAVRGLYIRGPTTTKRMFLFILDQMAKHDINAIVLDAKDYDGPVTYASKVPLAVESGAAKGAPIRDLSRVIRFAHKKGIHVVMRVSCFNDEFMSKAHPELAVQSKWGKPYPIGWLDPNNKGAQDYILALAQESIDAGADEIEFDYVRYPVLGIKGADFHLDETQTPKTHVIRDFVRRAHALTQAAHVPLSLDLFGVVAQGRRIDIDALGQDMAVLAPECEAFSPMVYPSHYSKGFYGWDNPGDHPEIVGIGVKGSLDQIKNAPQGGPLAVVRPWIQAEDYKTTNYSPQYLKDEIRTGNDAGGHGWLMWNPSQEYGYAWAAVPLKATTNAVAETRGNGLKETSGTAGTN
jgi:hypothetical protein